ncbi:MAG: ATP-binding protein [Desulfobacteraceae bacterium]|nr:ATP-binding protein [Desulfobacteraceae bacterium]
MKIKTIEYHDKKSGWKLNPVDFSDQNLALLVGVSGAGKTQIINAVMNLKKIANGASLNGVKWNITFSAENGADYCWQGEFENKELSEKIPVGDSFGEDEQFEIIYEKLSSGQTEIIKRDKNGIEFNGIRTPKLSPFQSIVSLLYNEDAIAPIYNSLIKINYSNQSDRIVKTTFRIPVAKHDILLNPELIKDIQKKNWPLEMKLAIVYINTSGIFNKIKKHFIDIFPQVKDIKYESVREESNKGPEFSFPLQIKEKDVDNWIHQSVISSGMLRTFYHICEIYLMAEGSVILIDEFENSLGVNCIDVITENLLDKSRNLQYIVTSHHPYIINNISMEHWKIVTRKGGTVTVKDAKDFNLGKTKHSAFIELLQLEEYTDGIEC